jgi:hypothetical protein
MGFQITQRPLVVHMAAEEGTLAHPPLALQSEVEAQSVLSGPVHPAHSHQQIPAIFN